MTTQFQNRERLVIQDGMVVKETVTVQRVVTEDALMRSIENTGRQQGIIFPFHPEILILAFKQHNATMKAAVFVPPRIDRPGIDADEVRNWNPDDKFLIAVPARVLFMHFVNGSFDRGDCFFIKHRPRPTPQLGYDPELYACLLPNQYLAGRMCTGGVFHQYKATGPESIAQAARMIFDESAYNNHFNELFAWPESPFSGVIPDGFVVPESLADKPVFETIPTYDYGDRDRTDPVTGNYMHKGTVMLWHFCRWQAWTEQHVMSWQTAVDELVCGAPHGTLQSHWRNF